METEYVTLGQNRTRASVDTWHDMGHDLSFRQKGIRAGKKSFFLLCARERREESQRLLSTIYGVLLVGIH